MGKKAVNPERAAMKHKLSVVLQVYLGELTAVDGAKALNVSRKTFYEYQDALLDAAIGALTPGAPGRPLLSEEIRRTRQLESENARLREEIAQERTISELKSEVIAIRNSQLSEREKKRK